MISSPENFELYLFDSSIINPDLLNVVSLGLFESSENVDVNGVTAVWDTYSIEYDIPTDLQNLMIAPGDFVTLSDGVVVTFNGGPEEFIYDTGSFFATFTAGSSLSLSELQVLDPGAVSIVGNYTITDLGDREMIKYHDGSDVGYIIDLTGDGSWDFSTPVQIPGYSVTANQGQSLAIVNSGVYNIWAEIL